jgi:hypothetical protein
VEEAFLHLAKGELTSVLIGVGEATEAVRSAAHANTALFEPIVIYSPTGIYSPQSQKETAPFSMLLFLNC